MPIKVRNTKTDYVPGPEGLHYAVCCDVVEHGLIETRFGKKRKVSLGFQSEEKMDDGRPWFFSKMYSASLHPKSNLRIDLESWFGKKMTDETADDFDLEVLLGRCCQLNIIHNQTEGGTYANIKAIIPAPKGVAALAVTRDYVRKCKRPGYKEPDPNELETDGSENGQETQMDVPDDDIPF